MTEFEKRYSKLNVEQKQAVDTIDGPVMVLAGPGTGKTELLSMRAANIIQKTDTNPANVLCLTFTDNAARNMRERLESIIGQPAYHIAIHTFHSFGGEIINQFPDYFTSRQLLQQIDDLGRYELLKTIFDQLPHSNPLSIKSGEEFVMLKSSLDAIGWLKQNAISPSELHELIAANESFIDSVNPILSLTFETTPSTKQLGLYQQLLATIQKHIAGKSYFGFPDYASICSADLSDAIDQVDASSRYAKSITNWRNVWCEKNSEGKHVFKDGGRNMRKMHALANVYQSLMDEMASQGLYDFDDMIIEAVHALQEYDDLRFNLQERYQYILVDEFQDTNKAQLRMLTNLGDNPVNEGRPNIMVVGDDDQAIYAFQGAEVSNMVAFSKLYQDPSLITLSQNYRSSPQILHASSVIASQISDRLEKVIPGTHKLLTAKASYKNETLTHQVFNSELAQYDWIAESIATAIHRGAQPEDIAVISPRHKYLERMVAYLGARQIPVSYERREDILGAPIIIELLAMSALVVAIANNQQESVDSLLAEVLGFRFWNIDDKDLLDISLLCYDKHKHWLPVALKHKNQKIKEITSWFVSLAKLSFVEPIEYMLDQFMGEGNDGADNEFDDLSLPKPKHKFISPMQAYYFDPKNLDKSPDSYLALLGQLSTLRKRIREWKPNKLLLISDLVDFANLHQQAHLKIIDTNPHTQTTNAVQVMTVYKAKGLEFGTVFVINTQDEIWGPTARKRSSRISLPKNLPIAPASDGDNDQLRLLYVALSRAKHTLNITSYTHDLDNKLSSGLSFIGGNSSPTNAIDPIFTPKVNDRPDDVKSEKILSTDWAYRFRQVIADKPSLFEPILNNYRLSVTHLNNFIDLKDAGPNYFLIHNLLRFPEAPTPSAAYGDAIHKTLQWAYSELKHRGTLPTLSKIQHYFVDMLDRKHLRRTDNKRLEERGLKSLRQYVTERRNSFSANDLVERGFNNDGVVVAGAKLSGKIDKIHFNKTGSSVQVIDYKTGKPVHSWKGKDEYEKIKLHKYRQQLLFYKLLVENSASFAKRLTVGSGALEFIEPGDNHKLFPNLELDFNPEELEDFAILISSIWQHILSLNFPDTSAYKPTLKGILAFENDLRRGTI